MKLRVLAAAAVAAWSKTAAATTASVLPGVLEQPAEASVSSSTAAATSCTDFSWAGPSIALNGDVDVAFKSNSTGCFPGTLSLQASVDQTHWKTLTSLHETNMIPGGQFIFSPPLSGTWWYEGKYVTDDGTFKGTSSQVQFTQ
jgi:hypothetical protein